MRGFTIFFALISLTAAAPQGYSYAVQAAAVPQPHAQYGPIATSSSGASTNAAAFLQDLQTVMAAQSQPQLQQYNAAQTSTTANAAAVAAVAPPQARFLSLAVANANANALLGAQNYQQHEHQQQLQQEHQILQQPQQQLLPEPQSETIVTKRFYLHAAPEEEEEEVKQHLLTVGKPRKNYNVVFIKGPAKAAQKTAIKITPAINEEKTVIYVLDKKHDVAEIDAQVHEPATTTTKPEVYFIKYKTPEEAAHAQQTIQSQYDALGGATEVSNEGVASVTSVIGTLDALKQVAAEVQEQDAPLIPVVPLAAQLQQQQQQQEAQQFPAESLSDVSGIGIGIGNVIASNTNTNNGNGYLPPARYYR